MVRRSSRLAQKDAEPPAPDSPEPPARRSRSRPRSSSSEPPTKKKAPAKKAPAKKTAVKKAAVKAPAKKAPAKKAPAKKAPAKKTAVKKAPAKKAPAKKTAAKKAAAKKTAVKKAAGEKLAGSKRGAPDQPAATKRRRKATGGDGDDRDDVDGPIMALPNELLEAVVRAVSGVCGERQAARMAQVSRRWYDVCAAMPDWRDTVIRVYKLSDTSPLLDLDDDDDDEEDDDDDDDHRVNGSYLRLGWWLGEHRCWSCDEVGGDVEYAESLGVPMCGGEDMNHFGEMIQSEATSKYSIPVDVLQSEVEFRSVTRRGYYGYYDTYYYDEDDVAKLAAQRSLGSLRFIKNADPPPTKEQKTMVTRCGKVHKMLVQEMSSPKAHELVLVALRRGRITKSTAHEISVPEAAAKKVGLDAVDLENLALYIVGKKPMKVIEDVRGNMVTWRSKSVRTWCQRNAAKLAGYMWDRISKTGALLAFSQAGKGDAEAVARRAVEELAATDKRERKQQIRAVFGEMLAKGGTGRNCPADDSGDVSRTIELVMKKEAVKTYVDDFGVGKGTKKAVTDIAAAAWAEVRAEREDRASEVDDLLADEAGRVLGVDASSLTIKQVAQRWPLYSKVVEDRRVQQFIKFQVHQRGYYADDVPDDADVLELILKPVLQELRDARRRELHQKLGVTAALFDKIVDAANITSHLSFVDGVAKGGTVAAVAKAVEKTFAKARREELAAVWKDTVAPILAKHPSLNARSVPAMKSVTDAAAVAAVDKMASATRSAEQILLGSLTDAGRRQLMEALVEVARTAALKKFPKSKAGTAMAAEFDKMCGDESLHSWVAEATSFAELTVERLTDVARRQVGVVRRSVVLRTVFENRCEANDELLDGNSVDDVWEKAEKLHRFQAFKSADKDVSHTVLLKEAGMVVDKWASLCMGEMDVAVSNCMTRVYGEGNEIAGYEELMDKLAPWSESSELPAAEDMEAVLKPFDDAKLQRTVHGARLGAILIASLVMPGIDRFARELRAWLLLSGDTGGSFQCERAKTVHKALWGEGYGRGFRHPFMSFFFSSVVVRGFDPQKPSK